MAKKIPGRTSLMPENIRLGNNENQNLTASRYFDHGEQQIIDDAAKAVETLRPLPTKQKETFASGFHDLTAKLQPRADEMLASREATPAKLPDPLPQPNVLHEANQRRGYTGRDAAE
jgi:hypothetical protein